MKGNSMSHIARRGIARGSTAVASANGAAVKIATGHDVSQIDLIEGNGGIT